MKHTAVSRRGFIKGSAALGGMAVAGSALGQDDAGFALDAAGQAAVEASHGVDYSDAEWAQMLAGYDDVLERIQARRTGITLENTHAPALTFDPRLPGRTYHRQANTVETVGAVGDIPTSDADIAFATTVEHGAWIRAGALTSLRLTEIYLDRIARLAPALENFVTVTADLARREARKADEELAQGRDRGPLHGIPYALKDLADTAGIRTTWGAAPWADRVAESDATIVTKLRDAGAVLLGKTTLGALAYGDRWFGGLTRNPWAPDEGSSGSSAGSASATAAALCSFSIGTETLGSIVSPSTRCGVTGLRPTFGRVSRAGAMALCWSLDKFGPICRGVEDTALVLAAINGYDPGDASSLQWGFTYEGTLADQGVTIGYDPAWYEEATDTDRAVLEMIRSMGYRTREIRLEDRPYGALITQLEAEAAAAFEELVLSGQDDLMAWQDDRAWPNTFRQARLISMIELIQADRLRRVVMQDMAAVYDMVDVIACPNFAGNMLVITNFTGTPSLTLPVGFEDRALAPRTGEAGAEPGPVTRLPHTFTLWGNMFREDQILGVGRRLEARINFRTNRPSLP